MVKNREDAWFKQRRNTLYIFILGREGNYLYRRFLKCTQIAGFCMPWEVKG